MADWRLEAPRRSHATVSPVTISLGDEILPGIATMFLLPEPSEPIACTLVGTPDQLRRYQRELDRAITQSIRSVRASEKQIRAAGGRSLDGTAATLDAEDVATIERLEEEGA
jgi:hypothetical protein